MFSSTTKLTIFFSLHMQDSGRSLLSYIVAYYLRHFDEVSCCYSTSSFLLSLFFSIYFLFPLLCYLCSSLYTLISVFITYCMYYNSYSKCISSYIPPTDTSYQCIIMHLFSLCNVHMNQMSVCVQNVYICTSFPHHTAVMHVGFIFIRLETSEVRNDVFGVLNKV